MTGWLLCQMCLCVWCDPRCLKTLSGGTYLWRLCSLDLPSSCKGKDCGSHGWCSGIFWSAFGGFPTPFSCLESSSDDSDLLLIPNFSQGWTSCTKAGRSWARDVSPFRTQSALLVALRAWWKYNLFNLICLTLAIMLLPFRFLVCICDTSFLPPGNWAPYNSWSGCGRARNLPLYEAFKVIIYDSKMIGYVSVSALGMQF